MQEHNVLHFSFLPPFILFYFILFFYYIKKNTEDEMHECNAMQLILETKEKNTKTKEQRTMIIKEKQ